MNVLILSCNTGQGHNSAAAAINDYFKSRGTVCVIKDALAYWSPKNSKIICKGHTFIYRNIPKLFSMSYKYEENHPPKGNDSSLMFDLVTKGCSELTADLKASNYDAVICTHLFPAMMMTKIKRMKASDIPTYFVPTDYTCYPGCGETDIEGYFIPHADLTEEFVTAGIDESKIIPSGIPVNPVFYKKNSKEYAKGMLKLPENKKTVLIMCGSLGCGPIKQLVELLPAAMPENTHLVAVCGNNRRLYKTLVKEQNPDLTVVGYTTRMSSYMDASDIILTKAGGLSSTEAAVKHLPIIFVDAVPGCETKNLDFFVSHGFADTAQGERAIVDLACDYLSDDGKAAGVKKRLSDGFGGCAAETIYNRVCNG
ncbi:MAG: hypothetical protein J5662_03035 [Clostridia bacterium]|nr:hypothetical protein [Clostridia bacterium]